ncbi:phenylacetic acid degradation operon negative regulatory protein [Leucobacter aridicollis]|uniref:Phenylacetic acid degradation operon negative regulatory protein n=1 Tax=Leucobacter aridicollis TaxID=283878 RepID=A0A852R066_9MICO|nr:phenylacetic acid degradation operon negative regulatory protein [Leucobacter aridicollis]
MTVSGLCRAGEVFGVGQTTVRVTLTRLVEEGKIRRVRRGVYAPPEDPSELSKRVAAWRRHGQELVAWRRDWVVVHDGDVLRSDKAVWRTHQRALQLSGFRSLGKGLQIRPNNRPNGLDGATRQLIGLGLAPAASVFLAAPFAELLHARASQLWDPVGIADELDARRVDLSRSAAAVGMLTRDDAVRETLLLGRDTISLILQDPVLPEQLMPGRARVELIRAMSEYQFMAVPLWRSWLAEDS